MQIAGSNGSGKTSLVVDAVLWALFGHARSSTTDGLMGPWGTTMAVSVTFEQSGRSYRVSRERGSRSSLRLMNLTDSLDMTEKHISLVQAKIESLVGSENAFVNTAIVKQGDALRFAQATPSERKALFDDLLGIEAFAEVERRANGKIRSLKVDEDRYTSELLRLSEAESRVAEVDDDLKTAIEIRDSLQLAEEAKSVQVRLAQDTVEGLGADYVLRSAYERDAREAEIGVLRGKQRISEQIRVIDEAKGRLTSLLRGVCPTCSQLIEPSVLVIEPLRERIATLTAVMREDMVEATLVEAAHRTAVALVGSVDSEITRRHKDATDARASLRGDLSTLTSRLIQARDAVSRLEGQSAVLKVDTSKTGAVRAELGMVRHRSGGFGVIAEAFSKRGIPRELTRSFASEVERASNALLIGLTELTVRITLDRDGKEKGGVVEGTVDVLVTDVAGERKVEMLSGGEKMRVMLAIRLAIQQVMAKRSDKGLRTLILDESLDGLDTTGKDAALTLLTGMTGSFDRMLMVSHDPSIAGLFPSRVELVKLSDGSSAIVS